MHRALSHVNIELAGNLLVLLLAILLATAGAVFIYRRTNPVVSNLVRRTLLVLRAACLVAVVLLVFQPVLTCVISLEQKPLLPVLVDQSASMALADDSGSRPAQVAAVLGDARLLSLARKARMPFFGFSTGLGGEFRPGQDTLRFEGLGTNIEETVQELIAQLRGQPLAGVVVVTDGAANMGEPLTRVGEKSPVPLFPVAVGSSKPQQDLVLRSAIANDFAYVGTEVPVEVRLVNHGFAMEKVNIELRRGGAILDATSVQLEARQPETRVTLRFKPEAPGVERYVVSASHLAGELTYENNQAEFVVKTLPGKIKVVLIAGRPSHDAAFLARALEADASVEAQVYICRRGDGFYRATPHGVAHALQQADCLFLLDFPVAGTGATVMEAVSEALSSRNLPLFWAGGEDLEFSRLNPLWEHLPMRRAPQVGPVEMRSVFLPSGVAHPLLAVEESAQAAIAAWQELPPVPSRYYEVPLWPNSIVLAVGQPTPRARGKEVPLIVARETPEHRAVALFASGFWRWHLMMWGVRGDDSVYPKFVQNLVRWLALREEHRQLRVRTDRQLYRSGEPILFSAQVYTPDFRPQEGAKVQVQVTGPEATRALTLEEVGAGRYECKLIAGVEGDYRFTANAVVPLGQALADTGHFSVTRWSVEFLNTASNLEELQQMAERSGGALSLWNDLSPLLKSLALNPAREERRVQFRYWASSTILGLIVILLGMEWFLRRRKGMV